MHQMVRGAWLPYLMYHDGLLASSGAMMCSHQQSAYRNWCVHVQDPWSQLDQSAGKDVGGQEARRIRYSVSPM